MMKRFLISLIVFHMTAAFAQDGIQLTKGKAGLNNVFSPDSLVNLKNTIVTIASEQPEPAGMDKKVKAFVNAERQRLEKNHYPGNGTKRSAIAPVLTGGFIGAANEGTPNDNNLAVNNDSFVMSVLNTFIRVYQTNGNVKKSWSLEQFPRDPKNIRPGSGVDPLDRSYDPKVVFDPVSNRFVLVYLEGDGSTDTRIIVAFSKTNSPLDGWYVYKLKGNPFGGTFWTDYPMIAINGEDLFITVNLLEDGKGWKDGFTQSIIWQVQKSKGYKGDSLEYNLWSNIKFNNKPIWNICPVQESFQPGSNGLYLLSVRPSDVANDTVFLHHITDSYASGKATMSYKVLKSDKQYGVPPSAPEKNPTFKLQTNDARVLGAFYNNNNIQFVQTSRNPINGKSSVYHGVIQAPGIASPAINANLISYDSLDIAYPTIVYAGNSAWGRQSLITFSHTGPNTFPGTSVIYYDNNNTYSDLVRTKDGLGLINSFIPDSMERWGDYTAIQRKYNKANEFWLVGSYGKANNGVGTWISTITTNDPAVKVDALKTEKMQPSVYPNPVQEQLILPFETEEDGAIVIIITDVSGKELLTMKEFRNHGDQKAFINVSQYPSGIYIYTVTINNVLVSNGKFSKY